MRLISRQLCFAITVLSLSGCSTISGRKQLIKISTDADHASVFDGDKLIGSAPGFFNIKRDKARNLTLKSDGETRELHLVGKYRWGESFGTNAVAGIIITPYGSLAGIGIDLLTGAAYEYNEPTKVLFGRTEKPLPPKSITIMPPIYDNEFTSDEIGNELYYLLKERYPQTKVISPEANWNLLSEYDVSNKSAVMDSHANEFYSDLNCTHIATSQVVRRDNDFIVKIKVTDILRDEVVDQFEATVKASQLQTGSNNFGEQFRSFIASLVPNSIGIQSKTGSYEAAGASATDSMAYDLNRDKRLGMFGSNLGIAISNVLGRRAQPGFALRLRLIPSLVLNSEAYDVTYTNLITNQVTSDRWHLYELGVGFGPELGLYVPIGYIYFNIIPEITHLWLSGPRSFDRGIATATAELGYSFFITDRIQARIFIDGKTYDKKIFEKVFATRLSSDEPEFVDTPGATYGISFEWVFPTARKRLTSLLR